MSYCTKSDTNLQPLKGAVTTMNEKYENGLELARQMDEVMKRDSDTEKSASALITNAIQSDDE